MPLAASALAMPALGLWLLAAPPEEPDLDLLEALGGDEAEVMLTEPAASDVNDAGAAAPCEETLEREPWTDSCPDSGTR
ncbi:MAG: hypothetical protein HYV16_09835 [Gammaproteobacteria bacterium]|nr:hypothetical protein [Gammaproteobacteria bacterium]